MESAVDEIKKKIDIIDFIGALVPLKQTGRNFKGVCPFHNEKTPSFIVSPERQIWHCFGACQEGGDAIKFFMKWENVTFIEAIKELANKLGIKLKRIDIDDKGWQKRERLVGLNNLAKDFFEYMLHQTKFGDKAREYLKSRDVNLQIVKKFNLGYAPSSWDSLTKFLKRKNYSELEIFETGLTVRNDNGRCYDRFRGRLMFPIKDARGNIIGFSGRSLDPAEKSAKYINTPETYLYHKRESLFGFDLARDTIKKERNAVLVEGEFDMILPYQHGIENIVAIKGSAVTKEQLTLLKRYTNRITLALDTDIAGVEAIKRGIEEAENMEFEIGIVTFDFGKDPDEAVRKDPVKFKKLIKQPIPVYNFILDYFIKKYPGNDAFSKKNIAEGVIPFITKIKNPIVESYTIKQIAAVIQVDEASIRSLMIKLKYNKKQPFIHRKNLVKSNELSRDVILQKYLLSTIFQSDDSYKMADEIIKLIEPEDLSVLAYQKIYNVYIKYKNEHPKDFQIDDFSKIVPNELKPVFDEIYLYASAETGLDKQHYLKIAHEIKRYSLKKQIKDLISNSENLNSEKDKIMVGLNNQLKELEKVDLKLYN